ncbi:NADH-quinone oxidoreductase subunit M [Nocardioides ochotonae]|uniref:NADH-quinone oxidoreductase subunit M n=1 Tax=Nocardioides ochotonae TaxID=2685869 RepID=UPI00140A647A|nr:NADH-quinone oxidoreductase subunit M [Nocardioides ochotonae]
MSDLPWLTVLFAVPLLGALVVAFLPRSSATLLKQVGIGVALLSAAVAVAIAAQFDADGGMQLTETHTWIEAFGVHYALGIDGLGLLLVLLTVVLVPVVLLGAWDDGAENPRAFVAWTLALEGLSLAVFTATDVFLFYVVFEATLIPAYFLIGGFGKVGRSAAAVKFLMFQLVGGLVLLAAVIGLYVVSADAGTPSYLLSDLMALDIDTTAGRWLFAGFFIAFAIKAPLFPVHTWLADTTEKATPGTSILLVCVLDKIGTFGMLRFCLGIFPEASQWATPLVVVLALISIVYGALVAIGQDDILRLIGLTSLSHFGFITLGIFAMSTLGGSGAVLYMVNHGLGTAALFLVAGYLIRRRGTTLISEMGGYERTMPVLAGLFLIAGLATLSLPGLSPFVSEFLVIVAAFDYHWLAGAVAVTGIVLAAIYVLWAYQRIMTGPGRPEVEATAGEPIGEPGTPVAVGAPAGAPAPGTAPSVATRAPTDTLTTRDLSVREVVAAAPLVVGLVLFGFWPMPMLDVSNPTVESLLSHVGVSDDPPEVDESTAIVGETEEGH